MARTVITVQEPDYDGSTITLTDGNNADGFQVKIRDTGGNDINQTLWITNGTAGTVVCTLDVTGTIDSGRYTAADNVISIGAGVTKAIGKLTRTTYEQAGVDTVVGIAGYMFIDLDTDDALIDMCVLRSVA